MEALGAGAGLSARVVLTKGTKHLRILLRNDSRRVPLLKPLMCGHGESMAKVVVFDEPGNGSLDLRDVAGHVHSGAAVVEQLPLHLPIRPDAGHALRHGLGEDESVALKTGNVHQNVGLAHLPHDLMVGSAAKDGDGFVAGDGELAVVKVAEDGQVGMAANWAWQLQKGREQKVKPFAPRLVADEEKLDLFGSEMSFQQINRRSVEVREKEGYWRELACKLWVGIAEAYSFGVC